VEFLRCQGPYVLQKPHQYDRKAYTPDTAEARVFDNAFHLACPIYTAAFLGAADGGHLCTRIFASFFP
jgi:hypothetical protein